MTRVIKVGQGREVIVNSDLDTIRLSLWINRGSSGIELSPDDAMEAGWALFIAGRRAKKKQEHA